MLRVIALVLLVAGCRATQIKTVGNACFEVIDAFCDRSIECHLVTDRSSCLPRANASCCETAGICDGPAATVTEDWQCADGIRRESCADLANSFVPDLCSKARDVSGIVGATMNPPPPPPPPMPTIWFCSDTRYCTGATGSGGSMVCASSATDASTKDMATAGCQTCVCASVSCTDSGAPCN